MATSDSQGDKILVKGIPSNLHPDKLTIYFQKRKVGGGDVTSVTFPVSSKEPDTAIVAFEDPKSVASVVSRNHNIGSAKLTVTALDPEPEIFDAVTAQISDFTIRCIKSKHNVDEMLENVCDSTGCIIENGGDSKFAVKGKWYQVQAAFERFEAMVSNCIEKSSQLPSANGYLSQTSAFPMTRPHMGEGPDHPNPTPMPTARPQKVVVSTVIDKDIYAYMELVHGVELADIRTKFKVSIKTKIMGEAAKVELVGTGPDADPQNAIKDLEGLSAKLNQTVGQDTVEIDSNFSDDELQRIFSMLRPEFPMVHMDKTDSAPDHIMFIAPDNDKCRMAMEMFTYYYKMKASAKRTGS